MGNGAGKEGGGQQNSPPPPQYGSAGNTQQQQQQQPPARGGATSPPPPPPPPQAGGGQQGGGPADGGNGGGAGGGHNHGAAEAKTRAVLALSKSGTGAPPPPDDSDAGKPQVANKKKKLLNGVNIEYRYPSGSKYVGGFKDGKLHGFGKYTYYPSGDEYEGEWWNDMKHGHGTYKYEGGDKYVGEWKHGKKHGKGTYTFVSGDDYCGSWREDKIHGYGVFVIARNGNRYEGEWEDSYRNGQGTLMSGNGDCYEGLWVRGKEEGQGVLSYSNGNRYIGEWRAGQMDGRGVLIEGGVWYTVEHIAGYLVGKTPIPEGGIQAVDSDWQNYYKAALAFEEKKRQPKKDATQGPESGDVTKLKLEKELYQKKYNEMLAAQSAAAAEGSGNITAENVDSETDLATLRQQVKTLLEGRAADKLLIEELTGREQTLKTQLQEAEYKLNQNGGVGGGSSALEKQNTELLAELALLREKVKSLSTKPTGSGPGGAETPTELKARVELLEGEISQLRPLRDELRGQRDQAFQLQKSLMQLEDRNEELLKELNLQHIKVTSLQTQLSDAGNRVDEESVKELSELRKQVHELNEKLEEAEDSRKKLKKKLKQAEDKEKEFGAIHATKNQLDGQLVTMQRMVSQAQEEQQQVRTQNENLRVRAEELSQEVSRLNEIANGATTREKEFMAQIEQLQSDAKKTKKQSKKMEKEKDALQVEYMAERLRARRALCMLEAKSGYLRAWVVMGGDDTTYVLDSTTVVSGSQEYQFDYCHADDGTMSMDKILPDSYEERATTMFSTTYLLYTPQGARHSSADIAVTLMRSMQECIRREKPKDRFDVRLQACAVSLTAAAASPPVLLRDGHGISIPTEVPLTEVATMDQALGQAQTSGATALFIVITATHIESGYVQKSKVTVLTHIDKVATSSGPSSVFKAVFAECLGGNTRGILIASLNGAGVKEENLSVLQRLRDSKPLSPGSAKVPWAKQ
eukprot:PhF_6_TR10030/c0_g1_i1/m.15370